MGFAMDFYEFYSLTFELSQLMKSEVSAN